MKTRFFKRIAVLLAVIIVFSSFGVLSAAAVEDDALPATETADSTDGAEPTDAYIADAQTAQTAADEPTEPAVTESTEQPTQEPTEAPTEAPTQAPTQAPTEAAPPTVGKVRNLDRTSFESDRATLTWDRVAGASGYYVYYLNADKHKNFSKVADVRTNTCTVRNLQQGTQYHFKVSAYIRYQGRIIEGEKTLKKTATQPSAVTGLTKWRSSDVLEMEWNRNPNASGYRIYRTESGGREVLYRTINSNRATSFSDTSVRQGRTYTYRVKSFRSLYGTSYSSDAGTIRFIAGLCGPDYTITSRCQRVNLTWERNPYATHYEVYYSTSPDNSKFVKLFTTPRLYYNTTKLTNGKRYYFRVRPIYKSGSTTIEGTSNKKSAVVTNRAYGEATGSTYIEVSIDQQHMWVYKDGRQIVSTEVVTGTYGVNDTPTGYYYINYKQSDTYLVGADYYSHVDYWMPFYGGYGIHDSSWRSAYGNPIYKNNGSHGCVNTPGGAMSTLYHNISSGTPVIIY